MTEPLDIDINNACATLTLNRPKARNALSSELRQQLFETIESFQENDTVAAIVITGEGTSFSAGMDTREIAANPEIARTIGPRLRPVFISAKPVIAAVNGPAMTGGLELALACDWIVASDQAVFGDSHARFGVTPGWGMTVLLAEAVGARRAKQLLTTGLGIDAQTALEWGLVNQVVPHDELLSRALEMASAVGENDRTAVATLLRTFQEQRSHADAALWAIEARNFIDPTRLASASAGK